MRARVDENTERTAESGFALILALLALLLLTFLGLTLAVTTSTELQIATNYRWSQQAVYAAEAGVEAGKAIMRSSNWATFVPAARITPWTGNVTPTAPGATWAGGNDAYGHPLRNFEGWQCDLKGRGMGYGVVLNDNLNGSPTPRQYVSTVMGRSINGAFTLWVRRPLHYRSDGTITDWGGAATLPEGGNAPQDSDNLILVAEGIAPFTGGGMSNQAAQINRAVHVIEVAVSHKQNGTLDNCQASSRSGQASLGPEGGNFGGCATVNDTTMTAALRGSSSTQTNVTNYGNVK